MPPEPRPALEAAIDALNHYVEDGWSIAAPGYSTVEHRLHARAALALVAAAAQAGARGDERARAIEECARIADRRCDFACSDTPGAIRALLLPESQNERTP